MVTIVEKYYTDQDVRVNILKNHLDKVTFKFLKLEIHILLKIFTCIWNTNISGQSVQFKMATENISFKKYIFLNVGFTLKIKETLNFFYRNDTSSSNLVITATI